MNFDEAVCHIHKFIDDNSDKQNFEFEYENSSEFDMMKFAELIKGLHNDWQIKIDFKSEYDLSYFAYTSTCILRIKVKKSV